LIKLRSKFSDKQLALLCEMGINISDDHDYSEDELLKIQEQVIESYLEHGFDKNGEPTQKAKQFESLIDFFYEEFDI
jgi:hypothetical protein